MNNLGLGVFEYMKIKEVENGVVLQNVQDFELSHIFECGQCFRWNKEKMTAVIQE